MVLKSWNHTENEFRTHQSLVHVREVLGCCESQPSGWEIGVCSLCLLSVRASLFPPIDCPLWLSVGIGCLIHLTRGLVRKSNLKSQQNRVVSKSCMPFLPCRIPLVALHRANPSLGEPRMKVYPFSLGACCVLDKRTLKEQVAPTWCELYLVSTVSALRKFPVQTRYTRKGFCFRTFGFL